MDVLKPKLLPFASDDRQRFRRLAVLAPALIEIGGRVYEGEVRNISTGGALIRVDQALAPDQRITLSIAGNAPLAATVIRLSSAGIGIAFQADTESVDQVIDSLASGRSGAEARSHPRRMVLLGGALLSGAKRLECTVQDLTLGGAGVRCETDLQGDDTLQLDIERYGALPVHVVRAGEHRVGCMFEADPAQVRRILGRLLSERKG
ncbi:MAG: PilZ domain-containing protein [Alphaproteobacteria bacterium]|nr:PilZ domain-containing protein [Alphaproteobacteria bacterium]